MEIAWSPIACIETCRPEASALIMRSRMAESGCIWARNKPRFEGSSSKGSKKYAVREPSDPSANPFNAPTLR